MSDGKKIHLQCRRPEFNPWVGKLPWRKEWLPTPVFLPRESHGQRSLVGYSLWGHKEADTTEQHNTARYSDGVGKWLHMLPNACCIVFKKKVAPGIRDSGIAERRWLREDSNLVALWATAHVKSSASPRTVMITCLPTHPRAPRASHSLWMKLIQRTKIMKKEAAKEESLGGKKIFQMQWYLSD